MGDPTRFDFGEDCETLVTGLCAKISGCNSCKMSWPKNDVSKWMSDKAVCRCLEADKPHSGENPTKPTHAAKHNSYSWGEDCMTLTDQDCSMYDGCSKCTFSWPLHDPLTWKSDEAKCRCKEIINPQAALNKEPVKPDNLTFGEDCVNLTDQDCGLVKGCSKCTSCTSGLLGAE